MQDSIIESKTFNLLTTKKSRRWTPVSCDNRRSGFRPASCDARLPLLHNKKESARLLPPATPGSPPRRSPRRVPTESPHGERPPPSSCDARLLRRPTLLHADLHAEPPRRAPASSSTNPPHPVPERLHERI